MPLVTGCLLPGTATQLVCFNSLRAIKKRKNLDGVREKGETVHIVREEERKKSWRVKKEGRNGVSKGTSG